MSVVAERPAILPGLKTLLSASAKQCRAHLDEIECSDVVDGVEARFRANYVRFDEGGDPKFDSLADVLVRHITRYVLSTRAREQLRVMTDGEDDLGVELYKHARDLFTQKETGGDVGELLLYFLLESLFEAPQLVCKMELKTNRNDEVKGSDGIHAKWEDDEGCLVVYLGEAKLHKKLAGGLTDALASIENFYGEGQKRRELRLVTSHFKHVNDAMRDEVSRFINEADPAGPCRIVHACLIGWDLASYQELLKGGAARKKFVAGFRELYAEQVPKIVKQVARRFDNHPCAHLDFEFLLLPFRSVQEFRDAFLKQLTGVKPTHEPRPKKTAKAKGAAS